MFRGPSFIVSTMQEETTPIFKRLWYDWTQQQPGIEPTNPLGHCWVPPIVAFYDQQGLLRTYSLPGASIRSPHPGSPRGVFFRRCYIQNPFCFLAMLHTMFEGKHLDCIIPFNMSKNQHTVFSCFTLVHRYFVLEWNVCLDRKFERERVLEV